MTTVIIYKNSNKQYKGFVCMGHAEYVKKSIFSRSYQPDVLCAAISTLVIHTMNSMEELAGELENMEQTLNEETGFMKCNFKKPLTNEKSVLLLDAMIFGLNKLSEDYGTEYLQVKFEEV